MNIKLKNSSEEALKTALNQKMHELKLTGNRHSEKGNHVLAGGCYKQMQQLYKIVEHAYGLTKMEKTDD